MCLMSLNILLACPNHLSNCLLTWKIWLYTHLLFFGSCFCNLIISFVSSSSEFIFSLVCHDAIRGKPNLISCLQGKKIYLQDTIFFLARGRGGEASTLSWFPWKIYSFEGIYLERFFWILNKKKSTFSQRLTENLG